MAVAQGGWFGVLLGVFVLGGVGCKESKPKITLGYKPMGVPVKFSVDTSGGVAVSMDRELRTPIGTFTLDVALERDDAPPSPPWPGLRKAPPETRNARWLRVSPAKGASRAAVRPVAGWERAAFTSLSRGAQVFATGRAAKVADPKSGVEKVWVEVQVEGRKGWIHQDNLEAV